MKNLKYLFLISIFLFCAPICLTAEVAYDSVDAKQGSSESTTAVAGLNQKLSQLEKEILAMKEDQEKIEAKNSEIKTELNNLRVWIHRR